jgi:NAD(P)H-hydrate epimerase
LCGEVEVVSIGIPDDIIEGFDLKIDLATFEWVSSILPVRPPDSHKGDFGRVLTVAGSTGMTGAAALAALASLRSGCGLAKIACPQSTQPVLATKLTEIDLVNSGRPLGSSPRGLGE